jgi:hypothetical protein
MMEDSLRVISPVGLPEQIPCQRHRLMPGARMGYKPNVVQLSTGELLLANFHTHYEAFSDGSMCEHIVLHRSTDGGQTWTSRHYDHLWGREPYLNVFSDDVLIITTHFIEYDVRNQTGHTTVYLHRSIDGGESWTSANVDVDMIPEDVPYTYTSRNIAELGDGTYVMGVGCGYGKDFLFRSSDRGATWDVERIQTLGFDAAAYQYSILQEGIFFTSDSGRLLLFARCDFRQMVFDPPLSGLPHAGPEAGAGLDHYDVEIVFHSTDSGRSWTPVNAFPILGCMYPSVCSLGNGRYLFTYTQRVPLEDRHMGVYALVLGEQADGTFRADPDQDLIVIDEKTPDYFDSGGGFGNTLRLQDGSLVTPYSFLDADPEIEALLRTNAFMEQENFDFYRNKALPYYRNWVGHVTWESVKDADPVMQRHAFLGCTGVLNLSGPITEVCRWRLEG